MRSYQLSYLTRFGQYYGMGEWCPVARLKRAMKSVAAVVLWAVLLILVHPTEAEMEQGYREMFRQEAEVEARTLFAALMNRDSDEMRRICKQPHSELADTFCAR